MIQYYKYKSLFGILQTCVSGLTDTGTHGRANAFIYKMTAIGK